LKEPKQALVITAVLTCFNRREKTLSCLRSYFAQELDPSISIDAVLVDDSSSDRTAEAVRSLDSRVTVIQGTGDLYWARGMALAEQHAIKRSPDYLLWLNDDVVLDQGALARLLAVAEASEVDCIAIGACRDPVDGRLNYTGIRMHRLHPLRFDQIAPEERPVAVETFSGNVILVPKAVALALGSIDGEFEHAAADFDYGMRATKIGVTNLLAPGTVGTCPRNPPTPWRDRSLPIRERVRLLIGRKGVPPRSRARYLRRHGGPFWPIYWLSPYARFGLSLLHPDSFRRRR
jgi:GT2 family glycosyltransferase